MAKMMGKGRRTSVALGCASLVVFLAGTWLLLPLALGLVILAVEDLNGVRVHDPALGDDPIWSQLATVGHGRALLGCATVVVGLAAAGLALRTWLRRHTTARGDAEVGDA